MMDENEIAEMVRGIWGQNTRTLHKDPFIIKLTQAAYEKGMLAGLSKMIAPTAKVIISNPGEITIQLKTC
jgi:hypothetical protein